MWKKFLGVYVVLALVALAMAPTDAVSQMCESTDGSPRECTISEELDFCLFAAVDAADQRATSGTDSRICVGFSSARTSLPAASRMSLPLSDGVSAQ